MAKTKHVVQLLVETMPQGTTVSEGQLKLCFEGFGRGDAFGGGGRELVVRHGRGRQAVPFVCDTGSQAKGFFVN